MATAGACPWDGLPEHLQERILSLLPVTELLPVAAASRALRRLLRSPSFHALLSPHRLDAFFLLSPQLAVHPLSRRVLPMPHHAALSPLSYPLVSSASPSVLITCASIHFLPPIPDGAYLLSVVVPSSRSSSTLVAVTNGVAVRSYTLDTADPSPQWASRGDLPLSLALLGNAAAAGDRTNLFVLGRGPDVLLLFDLAMGTWEVLPVAMPLGLTTAHLFVFDGRLFLVGGVERFGDVERVVVWQLDDGGEEAAVWSEVGIMPAEMFDELIAGRHGNFWHFQAADRLGILCLYNAVDGRLVMFDAANSVWTVLPRVSGLDAEESLRWFGHVLEPGAELLR